MRWMVAVLILVVPAQAAAPAAPLPPQQIAGHATVSAVEGRSASLLSDRVGYALFRHRPTLRPTRDGGRSWTVIRRWAS